MKYVCTLIVVKDMDLSKKFYFDILQQTVSADFGANVILSGGFALQTMDTWVDFIDKSEADVHLGGSAAELYFETDEMDGFISKLKRFDIRYVHPVKEHSWGQRVVRFYDPDGHIIEVGENIAMVVKRFMDGGMNLDQTAKRMDVPVDYIQSLLE